MEKEEADQLLVMKHCVYKSHSLHTDEWCVSHMKHVSLHKYFVPFMILPFARVVLALPRTFPPTPTFDLCQANFS